MRVLPAAVVLVWLGAIGTGLGGLWVYASTQGPAATPGSVWPVASRIAREPHRQALVVFAHPRCACSRATIGELALVMARLTDIASAHVLFYRPSDAEEGWERTDLWDSAAAIPGVRVANDENGHEAALFDASVSGQTLLYDRSGRLLFSGGITGARGHAGENAGRRAIVHLLTTGADAIVKTPVFGCFLRGAPGP